MNDAPPKFDPAGGGGDAGGQHDPLVGRTLAGRFLVRRPLARGGMGRLYEAEQVPLGRVCALKVLDAGPSAQQDASFARRFFLEASIAAKLKHPNTVTIFDYGQSEDGIYYIAMELLEGRTLRQALAEDGAFDETRAVRVARQIARSVREAHAVGIVHRDLKPANVMLLDRADEGDFVKVLDFGLAKPVGPEGEDLTASGQFVGTPKYMAPEQIEGKPVGPSVDLYALGVVLYEMAAGRPPFAGESAIHVLMAHLTQKPRPIEGVSEAYEAIVERALAKSPADRFGTIDELLEALAPLDPTAAMTGPVPAVDSAGRRLASIAPGRPSGRAVPSGRPSQAERANDSASGPLPSLTSSPRSMSRVMSGRRSAWLALGIAACCAVALVGGLYAGGRLRRAALEREAAGTANVEAVASLSGGPLAVKGATPDAGDPPTAAPAADAAGELVRIESSPPGAEVRAGGREGAELCPSTPCDVPRASLAGGQIYVARRGFAPKQQPVPPSGRQVMVRLQPAPAGAAKPT
ncbi:MAG TPA: serine/threonine-protein kinase, partial [Polyangiaceae bacterium]|nr:serine/threonine-protein kinase [Polyangiaceae bacterium]